MASPRTLEIRDQERFNAGRSTGPTNPLTGGLSMAHVVAPWSASGEELALQRRKARNKRKAERRGRAGKA